MLIAEIGNNHLGSMDRARELIKAARESGADIVKSQAFEAKDIKGSMPHAFYQQCQFSFEQYLELIDYARSIGTDLFYSIFSRRLEVLDYHQNYFKIAACQVELCFKDLERKDTEKMFVSIPALSLLPNLKRAQIMSVTDYMSNKPSLDQINFLSRYYSRPVGLSDHCIGVDWAILAIEKYDVKLIEKHFTLERNIKFGGQVFRDGEHAADPRELELLAKKLNE